MPIGAISKALGSVVGKGLGKTVASDIKASEAYLHGKLLAQKGMSNYEYHASNIKGLYSDSGLSKEWINGLIVKSKSMLELKAIQAYLSNPKNTYNLGRDNISLLRDKLATKYEVFRTNELINKLDELGIDVSDLF